MAKDNRKQIEQLEKQTLKTYFGYDTFRPGQEVIVEHILAGRDVLAVMPTGAGKSLCYQLPALLLPGITVVVSPLISLMMDQVKALNEAGVHAAYINSSLTESQIARALELAKAGQYKIIYVAPERLETSRFLDFACHTELSMITVDEAHCISQWGQDFRPSYVRIPDFIRQLPMRPVLSAFTATATERVREDILQSLQMENPFETVAGFDRENLYFEVQNTKNKKERIRKYVEEHRGDSGIIYCATRKGVDELYLYLESAGFQVGRYHAGMGAEARRTSQEDFIYDRIKVMIATNAFAGRNISFADARRLFAPTAFPKKANRKEFTFCSAGKALQKQVSRFIKSKKGRKSTVPAQPVENSGGKHKRAQPRENSRAGPSLVMGEVPSLLFCYLLLRKQAHSCLSRLRKYLRNRYCTVLDRTCNVLRGRAASFAPTAATTEANRDWFVLCST